MDKKKIMMLWNVRMFWKIKGMMPKLPYLHPLVMLGSSLNQKFMFTSGQTNAFPRSIFLEIMGLDFELD